MKYSIILSKSVAKELDDISEPYFSKINEHIELLKKDPKPHGCAKLEGRDEYKIRVGSYRIVYAIDDKRNEITIYLIDHRKQVYKRLKRK